MNENSSAEMIFSSLSDPTRLRIYGILLNKEMCVCQIESVLGMSQPRISRHLKILSEAGLIDGRKNAQWVLYKAVENRQTSLLRAIMNNDKELSTILEEDRRKSISSACELKLVRQV